MQNQENIKAFFCVAKSPVLVGSGEGSGRADCNIQRESTTRFPKIDASVIRGVAMENHRTNTKSNRGYSSRIGFSDLKILFFPVKSTCGTYTLITCPKCLKNFCKELKWTGYLCNEQVQCVEKIEPYVYGEYILKCKTDRNIHGNIEVIATQPYRIKIISHNMLEDALHILRIDEKAFGNIGIVTDQAFEYFVNMETEIVIRNNLNKTNLFSEEYLPERSILYGFCFEKEELFGDNRRMRLDEIMESMGQDRIYLGKNYTLGKGWVEIKQID